MSEPTVHYQGVSRANQDHYFSIDIETDGPIPGDFSMLSFGIVEAGVHDGFRYLPADTSDEFYLELQPLANAKFQADALSVNGLDRSALIRNGTDPETAMRRAHQWISDHAAGRRAVMVASPAAFDWMFMHWYFVKFAGQSPFGHSSCFDIKTMIAVKTEVPIAQSSLKRLPKWLMGSDPRTHNALDDARSQARTFSNVIEWRGATAGPIGVDSGRF